MNAVNPAHYEVDPVTGCWVWLLSVNNRGYGRLRVKNVEHKAHRYYYEQIRGKVPEGFEPDHECKKRRCVNPFHMEIVTHAVNTRRSSHVILTEEKVLEMRELHRQGLGYRKLAARFGVHRSTVRSAIKQWNWKGLNAEPSYTA
jgi:predicted DNA-binding protein (UPF0251 family)